MRLVSSNHGKRDKGNVHETQKTVKSGKEGNKTNIEEDVGCFDHVGIGLTQVLLDGYDQGAADKSDWDAVSFCCTTRM